MKPKLRAKPFMTFGSAKKDKEKKKAEKESKEAKGGEASAPVAAPGSEKKKEKKEKSAKLKLIKTSKHSEAEAEKSKAKDGEFYEIRSAPKGQNSKSQCRGCVISHDGHICDSRNHTHLIS